MIYIQKGKEPLSLTEYKKQPYAYYDGCNKDDIRSSLLREQGYLCAYCMRRINKEHMKIEHWRPEKVLTEAQKLDYRNILGVCEGHIDGQDGNKNDTCDSHKGSALITVDPRNKDTLAKIQYKSKTGEIYSNKAMAAETWTKQRLETYLTKYGQKDKEGKKVEYLGIVLWYLDKKMKNSTRK